MHRRIPSAYSGSYLSNWVDLNNFQLISDETKAIFGFVEISNMNILSVHFPLIKYMQ